MAAPASADATTARRSTDGAGAVDPLRDPEADRGAEQHHPLDAEVEDAGALGEELAERRVEKRRPVEHRLREHDHEQAVVDAHDASPPRPTGFPAACPPDPQPVPEQQLPTERAEEDDPLHHPDEPGREVGPLQRVPGVEQSPDEHGDEADGERVVARERRDDDAGVAERRRLQAGRTAVERVREVADLARAADAGDRSRQGHHREDLPARPHARVPRRARRVGHDAHLEPEAHARVQDPHGKRNGKADEEAERDDHRGAERRPVRRLGHGLALRERAGLERRRVAPVGRAVEDQVREEQARHVVEHQRRDDLVRPRERSKDARDQRPQRAEHGSRDAHRRRRRAASTSRRDRRAGVRSTTLRQHRDRAAPRRRC